MRTPSARESAARAVAALTWLGSLGGSTSLQDRAGSITRAERAKYGENDSGFGACERFYYFSAPFVRTVVDRYFSPEQQSRIKVGGTLGDSVRAIPAGTPMPPNPPAVVKVCADDAAAHDRHTADVAAQTPARDEAAQAAPDGDRAEQSPNTQDATEAAGRAPDEEKSDKEASTAAASDVRNASSSKRKVDLTVFGVVKMGRPLAIPDCVRTETTGLFGKTVGIVYASLREACKDGKPGSSEVMVHFPPNAVPAWAGNANGFGALEAFSGGPSLFAVLKGGVVVEAWMRVTESEDFAHDLREKYGPCETRTVTFSNSFGSEWKVNQYEWRKLPGLHVEFVPDDNQAQHLGRAGILTIELESQHRSKDSQDKREKDRHIKL